MKQRLVLTALAFLTGLPLCAFGETLTRTSAFVYDATGILFKEIIEPDDSNLCLTTRYAFDAYGNRTTATRRNCNGVAPEAAAPTGDAVFALRQNINAYAAGSTIISGTTYSWPAGQFATTTTNALGQTETREYDPRFGVLTKLTGPNGLVTTWTYDGFGRKTSETRADGTTTTWTYAICTNCVANTAYVITETTTGAPTKTTLHDNLDRVIASKADSFSGSVARVNTQYNALGQVSQVSKPFNAGETQFWTVYTYDILGRVTQVDEPTTASGTMRTSTTYNGLTTTVTVSNAGSGTNMPGASTQTRTVTKNSQGQVLTATDAQSNTITYTYDPFGNLKSTNAGGVTTTLTYDLRGRKITMADPDMGAWQYVYNAASDLIRQTDAKSQVTTITYDLLGRMTQRTEPDLVSNWSFDACTTGIGKLCQVTASNGYNRTIAYGGPAGRVSGITTTIDSGTDAGPYTVSYTYDSSGRLDKTTYPTGFQVQNVYNSYGYLQKVVRSDVTDATVFWQANTRNAAGLVTNETLGTAMTATRTYDELLRMTTAKINGGGSTQDLSYTYDVVNNVLTRVDNAASISENFTYDPLNRLLQVSGSGLTTRTFTYNAIGNLTSKSDVGTYTFPSVSSAQPHAVSSVTNSGTANSLTAAYTYDVNGALTSASGTIYPASGSMTFSRTLTYTSFNMPATIGETRGSNSYSYTYTYNAEHERVRLVTVRPTDTLTSLYFHPAGKGSLLYEREKRASDGRIEHKHYVNGGSGLMGVYVTKSSYDSGQGPEMRYYHRDNLGSVNVITNAANSPLERLSYEAFGERRNSTGAAQDRTSPLAGITTDRGYTGHEHLDELNLIHMNGRIYDPALARFMTADLLITRAGSLQSFNRYSYVNNNPLSGKDPSGFSMLSDLKDDLVGSTKNVASSINNWVNNATTDVLQQLGGVNYVGGLLQVGFLSSPYFGTAYGLSTGKWTPVVRAYATSAVLAAGVYAGGVAANAYAQPILFGAQGVAYSGATLSASQYVGANAIIAFQTSFAAAKINGASTQDAFRGSVRAAEFSVPFTLIDIAAINMRADTIVDSLKNPENATKVSAGYRGDVFGAGGCRFPCTGSPAGGIQGQQGNLLGFSYGPDSLLDWLVEANSGSHDYMSKWQYDSWGNTGDFFRSGVGNVLGWAGSAAALAISAPISFGSVLAPYSGALYSNRYLDYER